VPTYDYLCTVCGHREEVVHGIHAHGPAVCPVCGGPMRKAVTASAVHFKGSGWAKKDRGAAIATRAAAKADAGGDGSPGGSSKTADDGATAGSDTSSKDAKPATGSDAPAAKPSSSSASSSAAKSSSSTRPEAD
jgi:putative FmdB family regulatory protein